MIYGPDGKDDEAPDDRFRLLLVSGEREHELYATRGAAGPVLSFARWFEQYAGATIDLPEDLRAA